MTLRVWSAVRLPKVSSSMRMTGAWEQAPMQATESRLNSMSARGLAVGDAELLLERLGDARGAGHVAGRAVAHEDLVAPAGDGRELGVERDDAVDARRRHAGEAGDLVDGRLRHVAELVLGALQQRDQIAVRVALIDDPATCGEVEVGVRAPPVAACSRWLLAWASHQLHVTFRVRRAAAAGDCRPPVLPPGLSHYLNHVGGGVPRPEGRRARRAPTLCVSSRPSAPCRPRARS